MNGWYLLAAACGVMSAYVSYKASHDAMFVVYCFATAICIGMGLGS